MGPNDCSKNPCVFEGWKGNMLDYEEFFASVGEPLGSAEPRGEGCWERKFTRALVVLNPQPAGGEAGSCAVTLQPEVGYTDLQGRAVSGAGLAVAPASATVLLRKS